MHSTVHTSPIFTYGSAIDPPSSPHDSSEESVTPKETPNPCNNITNPVPNVPAEPNSDPSLSYPTSPELSDSLDDDYYKHIRPSKNYKNKLQSKTSFQRVHGSYTQATYSRVQIKSH